MSFIDIAKKGVKNGRILGPSTIVPSEPLREVSKGEVVHGIHPQPLMAFLFA